MLDETDHRQALARAAALEQTDVSAAGARYLEVLESDPSCLEAHNALERLRHPQRYGAWMRVNCSIHPDDDLFHFVKRAGFCHNPIRDYLSDGWRTMSELMQFLERLDRPLMQMGSVLEFASGYGRFTRHLAAALPGRVCCADVLPDAVAFSREQFGVTAFESSFEPESLRFPGRFDLVFVLSLFTHLPVERWDAWLRALGSAVAPGGLLVFSVHNEDWARRMMESEFPESGQWFLSRSESAALDKDRYGTTLTTRALVERQVTDALDVPPLRFQPTTFWLAQDAVAVAL
jgi:SAM-dependent methyltransferase